MREDYIKQFNLESKMNLKWYKGEDAYSEGDIEDKIIDLIATNDPESYTEAIYDNFNWSTYYHLSHVRKNILNWYPFRADAEVLEIGCGLGAITSVLCDHCAKVTAVELSKRRATAAVLRCREKDNLEVIVGNLNDIEFENRFDYITLIGVLEYQGSYTDTENPYVDFLKKVKTLLKPSGKLLIAIENQYGLKYWCGAREDHTAIPFDGMNQYTLNNRKVRTFSKDTLTKLINESGFTNTFFYYPMPDYKLPTVIYSQEYLPQNGNMQNMRCYYIPDDKTLVANEGRIYQDLIDNGVFEFFANSFLVECTDDVIQEHVTFASMSTARTPEYRIGTRFVGKSRVEKFAADKKFALNHINTILTNEERLAGSGINVLRSELGQGMLCTRYMDEELLENLFLKCISEKNTDQAYKLLDMLFADILSSSDEVDPEDSIVISFELDSTENSALYGSILHVGYLDMIMRNAFVTQQGLLWFDQEWVLENVPAGFVMYRALKELYASYPEIGNTIKLSQAAARFGLLNAWKTYEKLESLFIGSVIDKKHVMEANQFVAKNMDSIVKNINKIMG